MNELAITHENARKHARISDSQCDVHNDSGTVESQCPLGVNILCLPVEMIHKIFSYLEHKHLEVMKDVCRYFRRTAEDPRLWRSYEVSHSSAENAKVIQSLKKMTLLRKFCVNARADCDDILRQLSLTNRNLEELYISNCTGCRSKLYLRSHYLIRILERCRNLHTINICGSRFRGGKFYRLLGEMGTRLRMIYAPVTCVQFLTFVKHAKQMSEQVKRSILPTRYGAKSWTPLYYMLTKQTDQRSTALISYLHNDFVWFDVNHTIQKCDQPSGSSPSD